MTATDLTPDARAGLRALEAKATQGPWNARQLHATFTTIWAPDDPGDRVADVLKLEDAAFIAALRNSALPLLDALDRAEANLAAEREAHEAMRRDNERLHQRNLEVAMLASKWMEAHDKLKAGEAYNTPRPADLPEATARADQASTALASAQETIAEHVREIAGLREALSHLLDIWIAEAIHRYGDARHAYHGFSCVGIAMEALREDRSDFDNRANRVTEQERLAARATPAGEGEVT